MGSRPRSSSIDPSVQAYLLRVSQGPPGGWKDLARRGEAEVCRRVRWSDRQSLQIGPLLYVPSAVLARLRKEVGFAYAPHVGFRNTAWLRQVTNDLAAERLGIRVTRPRPSVRCPTCHTWAGSLQLERGEWRCRRCAVDPVRGVWSRIGRLAAYRQLGVFDRHTRALRRRLALRVLALAGRACSYRDLVVIAVSAGAVGPEPLDWTGRRRPRTRRGTMWSPHRPVHPPPGRLQEALAARLLDAIIDNELTLTGFARHVAGEGAV